MPESTGFLEYGAENRECERDPAPPKVAIDDKGTNMKKESSLKWTFGDLAKWSTLVLAIGALLGAFVMFHNLQPRINAANDELRRLELTITELRERAETLKIATTVLTPNAVNTATQQLARLQYATAANPDAMKLAQNLAEGHVVVRSLTVVNDNGSPVIKLYVEPQGSDWGPGAHFKLFTKYPGKGSGEVDITPMSDGRPSVAVYENRTGPDVATKRSQLNPDGYMH